MSVEPIQSQASEAEARDVAEAARETSWEHPSFARELFLGRLRMELIDPYPEQDPDDKAACDAYLERMKEFLVRHVDPEEIDRTGEVPEQVIEGLKKLGAFGLKIPKEYGGLGFSQSSYNRIMEMMAAHDAATVTLLSAHQSIGVPQPLKLFGTEQQKRQYLPRLAAGEISAFALTEPDAGSDPANMTTRAELDGDDWVLNGDKLWCTNGTIADIIVVMAQTPPKIVGGKERRQISAFIVETKTPGVEVVHRCQFLGLRGIYNGLIRFKDVRVPGKNLLWKEGSGLKLALITLNTGRLTLPSCCVGGAKAALGITRRWAGERMQWGAAIGKHDEVAGLIAEMASTTFAMQSVADLGCRFVDRGGFDVRLEAAIAKLWNSEMGWKVVNDCFQIRGGRGYETAESLRARGERAEPVERMLRDFRINTVVEGSTQIMHLFIAREALDQHLHVAGALLDPKASLGAKLRSLCRAAAFYAAWYPRLWFSLGFLRHSEYGRLSGHVRYIERASRRLARAIFHCMVVHRARLERRQRVLARLVDVGCELFAMATTVARARALGRTELGQVKPADTADMFCKGARRRIARLFTSLRKNDDVAEYRYAQQVLSDEHRWLESGILSREEPESEPVAEPAPPRVPYERRKHVRS